MQGFTSSGATLGSLMLYVVGVINSALIPLIFTLATLVFFWGVVQYVINGDDAEKKSKGRDFMIWGIIGLSVMISVWGLVGIVTKTFGIKPAGYLIPQVVPPTE